MIDVHTHLLHGVDDGARTIEQSLEVLRRFAAGGVRCVVCTPHLVASEAPFVPLERYRDRHEQLQPLAPAGLVLARGFEIMLDRPGTDLTDPVLSLGGSRAVLVEFPRGPLPSGSTDELARLVRSGVLPVVAHPERYGGASARLVREWREAGAVMQTDTAYLLGTGERAALAKQLLAEGLIDVLASDNHGDTRSLTAARLWLDEIGATEQARLLTDTNPGALLRDEPLHAVPPVKLDEGGFGRLRQLLRRLTPLGSPTIPDRP
jgi:protein-tyrosine phosphatase